MVLGLGELAGPKVARALQKMRRPSVIWLQLQECTGCVESVLRSADPTIGDLVLDLVSLDYSHALMAAAGDSVERALEQAARLLEPKVRPISIERATLTTPDDVQHWADRQQKALLDAIKVGPVLVS